MKLTKTFLTFKHKHLLWMLVFFYSGTQSQNLIPNGDFESTIYAISPRNRVVPMYYVNDWGNYSIGRVFCNGSDSDSTSYSGCNSTIIMVYNPKVSNCRSYIENKLTRKLQAGESCYFKMWGHPSGYYTTNQIGIYFSKDSMDVSGYKLIAQRPYLENSSKKIFKASRVWTLFSGYFVAKGGEEFIIIGNFYDDKKTKRKLIKSKKGSILTGDFRIDKCELYGSYRKSSSVLRE